MDESNAIYSGSHNDVEYLPNSDSAWFAADEDGTAWDVEIVDELGWSAIDEGDEGRAPDPFLDLVGAIERSACAFGATRETVDLLQGLLGLARFDATSCEPSVRSSLLSADILAQTTGGVVRSERFTRQVLAWQDILRSTSDDFSACGTAMLDEWSADLIARTLGGSQRADAIRRELRKSGVAAFGLVAAA